jgi:hypothetical protein
MRQNNVDSQNRELPTNVLALLLVTTRRPQSEWREGDTIGTIGQPCPAALQQFSDDDWCAAA